jgi:hypothetical protein
MTSQTGSFKAFLTTSRRAVRSKHLCPTTSRTVARKVVLKSNLGPTPLLRPTKIQLKNRLLSILTLMAPCMRVSGRTSSSMGKEKRFQREIAMKATSKKAFMKVKGS